VWSGPEATHARMCSLCRMSSLHRSGPEEARTILLLHIISASPSKHPLMVRTFLKVYDKSLTGEPILPSRAANQYLARYWFADIGSLFATVKSVHRSEIY